MVKVFRVVLFSLLLALPASADQIYVRNHLFKGGVTRNAGRVWVDLKAFSEALGAQLQGDAQTGFSVGMASPAPSVAGKVLVEGQEVESLDEGGSTFVPLEQAARLLGARVVPNRQLGTIDVSLTAKSSDQPTIASTALEGAAYTLIDFGKPGSPLTEYIQPALTQAASEFKNVQQVHCDTKHMGAYRKFKEPPEGTYPDVVLLDSRGTVLFRLRGNHIIAEGLLKEMRKVVKP